MTLSQMICWYENHNQNRTDEWTVLIICFLLFQSKMPVWHAYAGSYVCFQQPVTSIEYFIQESRHLYWPTQSTLQFTHTPP